MSQVTLDAADARQVIEVMSRLEGVCDAIEAELARRPKGRPRDWTVHGIVAVLLLLAVHNNKFHISHAEALISTLSPFQRKRLELNRHDGNPHTTRQISYAWNEICRAIDPALPGLAFTERQRRLELLVQLQNDMLWATLPKEVRSAWEGHVAVDATLLWAHGKPPETGNDKLHATGKDGDGPPTYVSHIDAASFDDEPSGHPFLGSLTPNTPAPEAFHPDGRRRRSDRKKQSVGACWIDNNNYRKVVFGYAHHTAVICAGENEAVGALPCVAIGQVTTPTTANPAACGRLLLEDIDRRIGGECTSLGDVLADGGYSQAKPGNWQLPIRALGGQPVFRLHSTNQEGHRGSVRRGKVLCIDGRFYCACLPEHLRNATYPHRPTRDSKTNQNRKARYRATIAARKPYELRLRAKNGSKGLRFDSPHTNGCPQCAGTDHTCCPTNSIVVGWADLGHYQRHQFGSQAWEDSYKRRTLVEGYFGNLKNANVGGHARDTAQFFEYAKTTIAFTMNAMATNFALITTWRARQAKLARAEGRTGRPVENHTIEDIANDGNLAKKTKKAKRNKRGRPPPGSRPRPDPFAHLATDPP